MEDDDTRQYVENNWGQLSGGSRVNPRNYRKDQANPTALSK